MKISIIGAGNMAYFIGRSFSKNGHQVYQVYNRSHENGKRLAEKYGAMFIGDLNDLSADVDAIFVVVKDSVIEKTVKQINVNTFLIHCAGAVPLDVLKAGSKNYGAIWPVYSVHKDNLPSVNIPLVIEPAGEKLLDPLKRIASVLSDKMWVASAGQREKMHLAAVISNNFMNHLAALAENIMEKDGLPFALLEPLLQQTFENMTSGSPYLTQTGPAIRDDKPTMAKHLQMLEKYPEMLEIYEVISRSIHALHKKDDN